MWWNDLPFVVECRKITKQTKPIQSEMCTGIECKEKERTMRETKLDVFNRLFLPLFCNSFCYSFRWLLGLLFDFSCSSFVVDANKLNVNCSSEWVCVCDFSHIKILTCEQVEIEWTKRNAINVDVHPILDRVVL